MPVGTMTETRDYCKVHVRDPRKFKSFRVITLSKRKGIKATIGSRSKRPYAMSSRIINVFSDKRVFFRSCKDARPSLMRIARKQKVM